jgi:hypothetical protein
MLRRIETERVGVLVQKTYRVGLSFFLEAEKTLDGIGMLRRSRLMATVTKRNAPRRIASSMSKYARS